MPRLLLFVIVMLATSPATGTAQEWSAETRDIGAEQTPVLVSTVARSAECDVLVARAPCALRVAWVEGVVKPPGRYIEDVDHRVFIGHRALTHSLQKATHSCLPVLCPGAVLPA